MIGPQAGPNHQHQGPGSADALQHVEEGTRAGAPAMHRWPQGMGVLAAQPAVPGENETAQQASTSASSAHNVGSPAAGVAQPAHQQRTREESCSLRLDEETSHDAAEAGPALTGLQGAASSRQVVPQGAAQEAAAAAPDVPATNIPGTSVPPDAPADSDSSSQGPASRPSTQPQASCLGSAAGWFLAVVQTGAALYTSIKLQ